CCGLDRRTRRRQGAGAQSLRPRRCYAARGSRHPADGRWLDGLSLRSGKGHCLRLRRIYRWRPCEAGARCVRRACDDVASEALKFTVLRMMKAGRFARLFLVSVETASRLTETSSTSFVVIRNLFYGEDDLRVETLVIEPLTKEAFAPFGDVIETEGAELRLINNGTTERYHDLARVEAAGSEARVLVNIFRGQSFEAPIDIVMMERHPFGSQAFIPLNGRPFLVVVAEDAGGKPARPRVFLARGDQGVNYLRNAWHHPLLALEQKSDFLVVDRAGKEDNLQEFFFSDAIYRIKTIKPA